MALPDRLIAVVLMVGSLLTDCSAEQTAGESLQQIGVTQGVVVLLEDRGSGSHHATDLARASELTLYVQAADDAHARAVREAADAAGLLGSRIFVESGSLRSIHLADNLADCILVSPSVKEQTSDSELLRVLAPRATAFVGDRRLVKPVPEGVDEWTHPYHGPDNNPQSNDQLVRGSLRTQFLGFPKFSPMPEQSVIAGGRIFKAMGHIAHKANQNEMLNTLLCINAYNGTILWRRPLPAGFMIHRNTMIATEDALYLGDHESCKIIDARTGETREQIKISSEISDGPVWKWMAMRDGILYALVGNPEVQVDIQRSARRGLGHWPWGMWEGHDYKDPRTAFGYGRTLVAIDLKSDDKKVLWHYRDNEFLDARAVCMSGDQIFCYSPERFLLAIDAHDGQLRWRNSDKDLLDAIDANTQAQHYITGYATTAYVKCNDEFIYFAGPQRNKMVAASATNGKLAWTFPTGNLQLVLRDDGIWAAGPQATESGFRLDYATGATLATFPSRRACTRATGCVDSIFFRAHGGTVRLLTESNTAQHLSPMRPPCQDGVLIAGGHLYWGPWMCGCELSLYGNIGLSPMGDTVVATAELYHDALVVAADNSEQVEPLNMHDNDWPSYRGGNARNDLTAVSIPPGVTLKWNKQVSSGELPTAPVVAGGLVFVADRSGAVRALDKDGAEVWKTFTAGPIYYPPAVAHDRLYVGSADGRVYAFEAKTGRLLWSFNVAPQQRWIPVFGKLISAWPVAGGIAVKGDTLYAAAGITHYDGTYIVALDALTGKLKAQNSNSGTLEAEVNNGISLQGELTIVDNELRFLAGGVYETARYDLKTLACLNKPQKQISSQFRTAFYPYYPEYGNYVSLDYTCQDGCLLRHDASYEGSLFTNLSLEEALPPGIVRQSPEAARWIRRGGKPAATRWKDTADRRFTSFVVSPTQILATGHPDASPDQSFLAAVNIKDGADIWLQALPSQAVKGGTAIDPEQNIYVSLENGRLLCFAPIQD